MALNKKSKEEGHAVWRPNFVNAAALPDTKAVRTNFIYNFGAIALALVLISFAAFNELQIKVRQSSLEAAQQDIASLQTQNSQSVRLSNEFGQESEKLEEVLAFSQSGLSRAGVLTTLSENDLDEIVLRSFSFTPRVTTTGRGKRAQRTLTYEIALEGTILNAGEAVELLEQFRQGLAESELLAPYSPVWWQDSFTRNVAANTFTFRGRFQLTTPTE
ncbi:MAG: hypothetical protein E1N59_2407 [Puniceicoccaceae bacterium 5H]|nr:MAG: hypothetical protein E1N59_2407 [Puniceicoccaceae bacterium 5H]